MNAVFARYDRALDQLLQKLDPDSSLYSEALALQAGLRENAGQTQRSGNTRLVRANRLQLLSKLEQLAVEAAGASFAELCWTDDQGEIDLRAVAQFLADCQGQMPDGKPTLALDELAAQSLTTALKVIQDKLDGLRTLFQELSHQGITITGDGNIIGDHNQVIIAKEGGVVRYVIETFAQLHQLVGCDPELMLADYEAGLIRRFSMLDLRSIYWLGDLKLPLDAVYVRLQATGHLPAGDMPFDLDDLKTRGVLVAAGQQSNAEDIDRRQSLDGRLPRPIPIELALWQSRHLVILGEPGSGKTTLLHYLALQFARNQTRETLGIETADLPIYVRLGQYAQALRRDPHMSLPVFVVTTLASAASPIPVETIAAKLQKGECLVLLDALDEVDGELRLQVVDQIDGFLNSTAYSQNRLIVTSRIAGYLANRLTAQSARTYTLRPFRPVDAEAFVRKWFQATTEAQGLQDPDREAERLTKAFLQLSRRPDLARLLTTPLLLQLAVAVFARRESLPQSRAELYGVYLMPTLEDRSKHTGSRYRVPCSSTQMRRILSNIAWQMHNQGHLTQRRLLETIETTSPADSDTVFHYLHERLGMLADFGDHSYGFTHLTFQEYFVASYLYDQWHEDLDTTWRQLSPVRHRIEMREPILLLAGLLGYHDGDATVFVQNIWQANAREQIDQRREIEDVLRRDLLLAGWCLAEVGEANVTSSLYESYTEDLIETWEHAPYDRLRDELMGIFGIVANIVMRTEIAERCINHHTKDNLSSSSYELDFATMRALGHLGIVNDRIKTTLRGVLPEYSTEPISDRDGLDWAQRWARSQEYNSEPITKLQLAAIDSIDRLDLAESEIVHDLVATLKLRGSMVRHRAAEVLARFSEIDSAVIDAVANILNEHINATRYFVGSWLAQLGETHPGAVHTLLRVASDKERSWPEREVAIKSLGTLIESTKGYAQPEVYEVLLEILVDRKSRLEKVAAESLGKALPKGNFGLAVRVISALIFALGGGVSRKDYTSDVSEYAHDSFVQTAAEKSLFSLLEREIPPETLYRVNESAENDGNLFLTMTTSSSVCLRTILVCILVLANRGNLNLEELIDGLCTALLIKDQERVSRDLLMMGFAIDPIGTWAKKLGGAPKPGTGGDIVLRSLFGRGTLFDYMDTIIRNRWHEIQGVLNPMLDQLAYGGASVANQLVRGVLHGVMWSLAFQPRHIVHPDLASSPEHLRPIMSKLIPTRFTVEEEQEIQNAIHLWGQFEVAPEVIDELCSIAEESRASMKSVAAKMLGELRHPTDRVIKVLTQLLSDDSEAKRPAAEALTRFRCTKPEVIKALLDSRNFLSENIWYAYPEPVFLRALGALASEYEDLDQVMGTLILALDEPVHSSIAAAEGLGLLGQPHLAVVVNLVEWLPSQDEEMRRTVINSLIQLARVDRGVVVETLLASCKRIGIQMDPFFTAMIHNLRAQAKGIESVFSAVRNIDTHNYAYDALWAVVEAVPE